MMKSVRIEVALDDGLGGERWHAISVDLVRRLAQSRHSSARLRLDGQRITTARDLDAFLRPPPASPWRGLLLAAGAGAIAYKLADWLLSPTAPTPHNRAVHALARKYRRRGADVRADLPGWPRPPVVCGRRPDVVAVFGKRMVWMEVETRASVSTSHSKAQHDDLLRCAATRDNVSYRRLVV